MDTEILKHPDCPFDVIVRNGDAQIRYKRTQSLEPANPQIVLTALLIKELMANKPLQEPTADLGKLGISDGVSVIVKSAK